jgi:hypothetical protein
MKPNEVLGSRADLVNRVGQTGIRKVYSIFVLAVSNADDLSDVRLLIYIDAIAIRAIAIE